MFRLNNRGQSLVMFVVIIPIFLLIITLIYDVGNAIYEKNSLSNTVYMAIDYYLDNIDSVSKSDVDDLIMSNENDISYIKVDINNGTIDVIVTKRIKGIFGKMFNFNLTDVSCHYMGKMVLDKKVIERV